MRVCKHISRCPFHIFCFHGFLVLTFIFSQPHSLILLATQANQSQHISPPAQTPTRSILPPAGAPPSALSAYLSPCSPLWTCCSAALLFLQQVVAQTRELSPARQPPLATGQLLQILLPPLRREKTAGTSSPSDSEQQIFANGSAVLSMLYFRKLQFYQA